MTTTPPTRRLQIGFLLWMLGDLWTRSSNFTIEVIPPTTNWLWTILSLLLVAWMIHIQSTPIFRWAKGSYEESVLTLWILYLFIHSLFVWNDWFWISWVVPTVLWCLLLRTWNVRTLEAAFHFLFYGLFFQGVALTLYVLIVRNGQTFLPSEATQELDLGWITLRQTYVGNPDSLWFRSAGPTNNPNTLSAWLTPGFIYGAIRFFEKLRHNWWQAFLTWGIGAAFVGFGILLTKSQTGIYSAVLLAFVLLFLYTPRRVKVGVLAASSVLPFLFLIFLYKNDLLARVLFLNGRDALWSYGWGGMLEKPLFGNGLGSSERYLDQTSMDHLATFHSSTVQWGFETGIIGLLFYALIWAIIALLCIHHYRHEHNATSFLFIMTALWLFLLQLTESVLARPSGFFMIWVSLLLVAIATRRNRSDFRKGEMTP